MCGAWNASLSATPKANHESAAFALSWSAAPASCPNTTGDDWDGVDTYTVRRAAGAVAPSSPTSGTLVATTTGTSLDDFVHRSNKQFSYAVFACEDASCTSSYGDASGSDESVSGTTDTDTTGLEKWELDGITGETDGSGRVVDDNDAMAPHPFFYPSGWAAGYSGNLALYYSKPPSGGNPSEVYHLLHDPPTPGWPPVGFNDSTDWGSPTLVAVGSTSSSDDDYQADHPWAMLYSEGGNNRVALFTHSQGVANPQILQILSTDATGTDFGLSCSGGTCDAMSTSADFSVAVAADGTSATDYVVGGRHSRVVWDYIADPVVTAGTDLPGMLFQLELPSAGTCASTPPDDLGWVDGTWDSGAGTWDWAVELAGSCPNVHVADRHDNSVIPLPDNEFKAT